MSEKKHWLIRVADGVNFKNSKYAFWGLKRGKNVKAIIQRMNRGDIIWFFTSKIYGGKIIGMAEYVNLYDRSDEPLLQIHTLTNEEQNWIGTDDWDLQIHYTKLYNTEKQNLTICIQCSACVIVYDTFRDKIPHDLERHYQGFSFYADTVVKPELS